MKYHVLASGSKGNSTFIYENGHGILIDCGISRKQLIYRLETLGYTYDDISCVLLTHDHYDHSKNISIFNPDLVYCGKGAIKRIDKDHILEPYQEYELANFKIFPLVISHDAHGNLAFIIEGKEEKILYMTDTGYISQKNQGYINNLDYYIIESNHDMEMLMATNRPYFLKNRILGDQGHLNNKDSANVMSRVIGDKTKEICLAHLSQEANTEEKALETYYEIFREQEVEFLNIKVASQVNVVSGGKDES